MSQPWSQPTTGGVCRRRISNSAGDRRASATGATPSPLHAPSTQPHNNRRVASATTNYRDRLQTPSRPQSSERFIPAKKPSTNLVGRNERQLKQLACHDYTGNRKSPGNQNKRPPFVVSTGNATTYRGGGVGGGCRTYATTKTESRSRSSATPSKDRRAVVGCVAKDSVTELKTSRGERPAAHGTETMTLISGDEARHSREHAEYPYMTESSGTIVVADPLPEVFFHRINRKQRHQSADECIKQVAEKLSEFAAIQNDAPEAVKCDSSSNSLNGGQRPIAGNDVTSYNRRGDVTGSPRARPPAHDGHSATFQAATISDGNDVSGASRRVVGPSKKAAEVLRSGSTRLTAACRPSPTRSSLLRQALNCPAGPQRAPRTTRPAVCRTHRSATELGTENNLPPTSQRQNSPTKQGRVGGDQTSHETNEPSVRAAQLKNSKHQMGRRFRGDRVDKPADSASAAATRELQDPATTTKKRATGQRSVDVESSGTYNVDGRSSTPSSLSTPRTYVVEILAATDDESSRQTSPRVADRLARVCRRRRPKSLENERHNGRLPASTPTTDVKPEIGYPSHHSSSAETFVCTKPTSRPTSSESSSQRRRRSNTTSPKRTAVVMSSTPHLPEVRRPSRHRRSSASSEGEVAVPIRAEPVRVQHREDSYEAKKSVVCDHQRASRLPRLVTRPHDMLPSTSSVSVSVVRAPRPRSFRYSRLHRRAVEALLPPTLRDVPWRWAWKADTDIN